MECLEVLQNHRFCELHIPPVEPVRRRWLRCRRVRRHYNPTFDLRNLLEVLSELVFELFLDFIFLCGRHDSFKAVSDLHFWDWLQIRISFRWTVVDSLRLQMGSAAALLASRHFLVGNQSLWNLVSHRRDCAKRARNRSVQFIIIRFWNY
jgi:hypothetical protein